MAMIGEQEGLVKDIMKVLQSKSGMEKCFISMDVPDEDGNIKEEKFPLAAKEGNVTYATKTNIKTGGGLSGSDVSGSEAMVAVIVDKTISFIIENYEAAWMERFETLEDDFNKFVTGMMQVGPALAPLGMPPGAGAAATGLIIAACSQVKGPGRTAVTTGLRAKEKLETFGTGNL
jgi:hypothetical protein